ncbi:MAG: hypothetical protein HQL77_10270 [Magnetococcales bacterium]|nr:hypothetical protein [Magnetococcales bacterium]
MGEAKNRQKSGNRELLGTLKLLTLGGVVQVQWKPQESATPMGQMAFFIEFLNLNRNQRGTRSFLASFPRKRESRKSEKGV